MPRNQGEVMWPRLVASKLLKKGSGSNNFVADFPCNDTKSLEADNINPNSSGQPSLTNEDFSNNDHKVTHHYEVFVGTWNVGGVVPEQDLDLENWLDTSNDICDIYVFGFQEIVPLKASNVLGPEKSKISMKWNSIIRQALNKKTNNIDFEDKQQEDGIDQKPIAQRRDNNILPDEFKCIISKQMVGILISVWIRISLVPYVRHPNVSCVGCGIMGCLGNKGAVSVRFRLHETSFCFVCSHLVSGGREGDEKLRNSNVAEILSRTIFPRGPSLNLPRNIREHDRVIFLGDLNYRIALPELKTRTLVDKKEWNTLLENDQLRMEFMEGQAFAKWQEGSIKFAPTYKYFPNSDIYYGYVEGQKGKKGKKSRAPAWCDRIIWFGQGLKQHVYTRGELDFSDHRPVKAIFTFEVDVLRAFAGFQDLLFSSEKVDEIE